MSSVHIEMVLFIEMGNGTTDLSPFFLYPLFASEHDKKATTYTIQKPMQCNNQLLLQEGKSEDF